MALTTVSRPSSRWSTIVWQLGILGALLMLWQFLPQWPAAREAFPVLDPYFVSSPVQVAEELMNMLTGAAGSPRVLDFIVVSIQGILIGTAIGLSTGMLAGAVFSQFRVIDQLFAPYLSALNATPRLVLVPLVIIFFGPTLGAAVAVTSLVVFLTVFFPAYAGGKSVPLDMVLNSALLGARPLTRMFRVRGRYVTAWSLSVLPNTLATAYVAAVLTELLSNSAGLGRLVRLSLQRADATMTYALVVIMAILGVLLVYAGRVISRRLLHWWAGVDAL